MDTPNVSARDTRASLLARLRDIRDAESWETFVQVYAPMVYGYARRRGLQDADAADVAQDVLTEVARCIRGFEYRPEQGRFRDWLGTVTRRRLARFFARQAGRPDGLSADPPDIGADAGWDEAFNARLLEAALERAKPHFEPATWQAFRRTWLDNVAASQAAAELGLPVETVYVARSRVLKRLRDEVTQLAEDVPQLVPLQ